MFVWLLLQCSFFNSSSWKRWFVPVPLSPHLPSVPHLNGQGAAVHIMSWRRSVCISLFPEWLKYYRVWVALCPLQIEVYCKTVMAITPLSQSCCWSLLLSSEQFCECWFLPLRGFLTHRCLAMPACPACDLLGSHEHPGDNGTAQLDKKKASENTPVLSACTKKDRGC